MPPNASLNWSGRNEHTWLRDVPIWTGKLKQSLRGHNMTSIWPWLNSPVYSCIYSCLFISLSSICVCMKYEVPASNIIKSLHYNWVWTEYVTYKCQNSGHRMWFISLVQDCDPFKPKRVTTQTVELLCKQRHNYVHYTWWVYRSSCGIYANEVI